ncbi:hypothetical protein DICA0_F12992 [Diutina catenulata]
MGFFLVQLAVFLFQFAPIWALASIHTVENGTTWITAKPDKFSKIASELGLTQAAFGSVYGYLYESYGGSIPLETLEAVQTNSQLALSIGNDFKNYTKTHTGGGEVMGVTGAVVIGLSLFLL